MKNGKILKFNIKIWGWKCGMGWWRKKEWGWAW